MNDEPGQMWIDFGDEYVNKLIRLEKWISDMQRAKDAKKAEAFARLAEKPDAPPRNHTT